MGRLSEPVRSRRNYLVPEHSLAGCVPPHSAHAWRNLHHPANEHVPLALNWAHTSSAQFCEKRRALGAAAGAPTPPALPNSLLRGKADLPPDYPSGQSDVPWVRLPQSEQAETEWALPVKNLVNRSVQFLFPDAAAVNR